jgi:hypothetical protein
MPSEFGRLPAYGRSNLPIASRADRRVKSYQIDMFSTFQALADLDVFTVMGFWCLSTDSVSQ